MNYSNLQNLEELRRAVAKKLAYEPYRLYRPIGKVEEFINLVGSGDNFISLLTAANGVGKTTAGINILAHLFWPCGNQYFQAPLFKNWLFLKKGRIVSDPTTIEDTIIPAIKEIFPRNKYTNSKAGKRYEYLWKTDTGWDFNIMSYEQDVKEFESATLGWAWFDEPPPEAIFKATVARMRKGGIIFITATPLMGSAWMYDHIVANTDKESGQRDYIEAELEDACIDHGERGFLEHNNILKMVAEYDEEDLQPRVFGKFQHLVGLIYKKFSRKIHVIPPFKIDPKDYVVGEYLDPHPRVEDAVLWLAVDKKGTKIVCNELFGKYRTEELAERTKDKAQNYRIITRKADPSAFIVDKHTGTSLAGRLSVQGLYYQPASKARLQAIWRTKDALNYQMVGNEMIKAPELYVFETCRRTIYEFEHWQWEEWRGKTAEYKGQKEKPVDKEDHMMENLGRALLDELIWSPIPKRIAPKTDQAVKRLDPFD